MSRIQVKKFGISIWSGKADYESNALKQYLNWLRAQRSRARFGHADPATTLHRSMTLVENLLMASQEVTFDSTYAEQEALLNLKLETLGLRILASWFKDPRRKVSELLPQEKMMASICFALLSPAEEILVDLQDVDLDPLCWAHLQKILLAHSKDRHITVRLNSLSQWNLVYDDVFEVGDQGLVRIAA